MNNQRKSLLMGGVVVLFWATVATAFKIALAEMGYVQLLLISSITALLICSFEVIRSGRTDEVKRILSGKSIKDLYLFMLQALLTPFLYYLILFKAYSLLPAQIAQPLNYSWQVVLILMMAALYKKKLTFRQITGVIICFAGVLALSLNNKADITGTLSVTGVLLALGSSLVWSTYWISKLKNKTDPVVELFFNFLFGSLYLLVLSLFIPLEWPSIKGFFAGIYVGCFEMGLTFIIWAKALKFAENKIILTQMTYLSPLLSLILIHYILGEEVTFLTFAGLFLVIGGIYISNRKSVGSIN